MLTECQDANFSETNSKWFNWKIKEAGSLTFVISPQNINDDIDFILFKSKGIAGCDDITSLRCMVSGEELGDSSNDRYLGNTGLDISSLDDFESQGCKYNSDGFIKYVSAEPDEEYYLLVNNYDSNKGLSISFGGTASFAKRDECIAEETALDIVNVYPSPAKNILNVEFTAQNTSDAIIQIMDFTGRLIRSISVGSTEGLNKETLDISDLTAQSYLIKLTTGDFQAVKTFIKQ